MAMNQLLEQAKEMQKKLQNAQNELSNLRVSGEAGAGLVKVTMNGRHEVNKVDIDDEVFEDDEKDMLEDLVAAAFNDAVRKVEKESQKKMMDLTKGLNLPKDLDIPMGDDDK